MNKDKIKGMIYGQAIGDALGAPTEFMTPEAIAERFGEVTDYIGGGAFGWEAGEFTDDTDQAIMLAKRVAGIRTAKDVTEAVALFGQDLVEWSHRTKDMGNLTSKSIRLIERGFYPTIAALLAVGPGSGGNGSIMRTAPLAVPLARIIEERGELIDVLKIPSVFSSVTHAHPTPCHCCEILVALLIGLITDKPYSREGLERLAKDLGIEFTLKDAYDIVDGIKDGRFYPGGYSVTTLAWGLWAADEDKTFDFIFKPVNMGGDADTNAAVAGAVFGAKLGFQNIRRHYNLVDGLLRKDELNRVVEALVNG